LVIPDLILSQINKGFIRRQKSQLLASVWWGL